MTEIVELGHVGLWVSDLDRMCDFYVRVLGLALTDRDDDLGMVFLSSRPEVEHHELVLQRGRKELAGEQTVQQLSWRVSGLESLLNYHKRFLQENVFIQQIVTHGNALGIYFFDPEGNRGEVYWATGVEVRQPFRKSLTLDGRPEEILSRAEVLLHRGDAPYQPILTSPAETEL